MPRTFGHSDPDNGPENLALALIATGVTAKLAREIGAPRLAIAAARRTRELADRLVISLSPMLASTTADVEDDRLGDVRCTGDLAALLRPTTEVTT